VVYLLWLLWCLATQTNQIRRQPSNPQTPDSVITLETRVDHHQYQDHPLMLLQLQSQ